MKEEDLKIGSNYNVNWRGQLVTGKLLRIDKGFFGTKYLFEIVVNQYNDEHFLYKTNELYKTTLKNIF